MKKFECWFGGDEDFPTLVEGVSASHAARVFAMDGDEDWQADDPITVHVRVVGSKCEPWAYRITKRVTVSYDVHEIHEVDK